MSTSLVSAHPFMRAGPVLYMSGYPQELVPRARILESGTEVFPKPFTAAMLLQIVRKALDRESA